MIYRIFFFALAVTLFSNQVFAVVYDRIRLVVGDQIITQGELTIAMGQEVLSKRLQLNTPEQRQKLEQKILNQKIDNAILEQRADDLNITISAAEIDRSIEQFKDRRKLTDIAFEEFLEASKYTVVDFRKFYTGKIRRDRVVYREVRSKIKIQTAELKKIYAESKSTNILITAQHILRQVKNRNDPKAIEKAKNEALWLITQLKKGVAFEKLAIDYSDDPGVKVNKGLYKDFPPTRMVKEFAHAVTTLPIKKFSDPVKTEYGFHVIQVLKRKEVPKKPFVEVRKKLYRKEFSKRILKNLRVYIQKHRKQIKIEYRK
jgi:foldase protein PrsA